MPGLKTTAMKPPSPPRTSLVLVIGSLARIGWRTIEP